MKNGRQLQEPRLTPPPPPPVPPVVERAAPKPAPVVIGEHRIELVNPMIVLPAHIFIDAEKQVGKLTPKRAVIAHGVIVIEEMNLIVPVHGVVIRTERT